MTSLNRKLVRDLLLMKGQALAIALVMACGVATFVMSLSTLASLQITQQAYYERYRFAHVFAHCKRAPNALAERIAAIEGVAKVQTRVAVDVTLDVAGLSEPAVGHIVSIPDRQGPGLNEIHLRKGRYIEPGRRGEAIVSEAFAEKHALDPGASVVAIINGRRQALHIVGVALSPEHVMQIRAGEMLPDDIRYGIFWMGYTELASAFDMDGAFNDITLTLMRGASEPEVLRRLDALTEPYGGIGAYGRADQMSNRFLTDEIKQLRTMSVLAPTIFLSVAAFLLNVVITRLISTQREQIAALKAFGYTKPEVGWHYLKFVLLIVAVAVVIGFCVGIWLGRGMTQMYTVIYRFPIFYFRLEPSIFAMGLFISTGAGVLGTLNAVRAAIILPPAEAMRPEPPAAFKPTLVERVGLAHLLAQSARMVLRQLERKPVKSGLSCLGIALAASVLVLGQFSRDAIDYLMEFQFVLAQRQDMTVSFVEACSSRVIHEVEHLPGVMRSEPFRAVSVRLRHGHLNERVGIMGLVTDPQVNRVLDTREHSHTMPAQGVVMSEKLAEILALKAGDTVRIEVMEGLRPVRDVLVTRLVRDLAGTNAYMHIDAVNALMREGETYSGAYLVVDPNRMDELFHELKRTPKVAGVTVQKAALQSFKDTIRENLMRMQVFNVIFASIIAFGVVYNTARISLSERSRELATLRVIGFTRGEISAILLGELGVITFIGIPLGLCMGYGLAATMVWFMETEMFRIPLVVSQRTFAFASTVVIIASLLSGLVVRRRLDHLDLVSVLKSKE
jgi:putative ABC transport system permease protein